MNTVLDDTYRVTDILGAGGFGVTYRAEDLNLNHAVAIKEFYPLDHSDRDATMSVRPKSHRHRQTFDWGRSNFLQEAHTLARFEHPSIVRVTRVFEANATAYMVMRFEGGQNLVAWLSSLHRPPSQEELDAITGPLLDALERMHDANFLHRDIAPDNIIVRADGTPVLIDFGAARRAVNEEPRSITRVIKPGFSPQEQYSSKGHLQGPWSDIYALGGTLFYLVASQRPTDATQRNPQANWLAAALYAAKARGYRPSFLAAICACLEPVPGERPQSIAELRAMLADNTVSETKLLSMLARHEQPSATRRANNADRARGRLAVVAYLALSVIFLSSALLLIAIVP